MQNPITSLPTKLIPQIKAALPGVVKYAAVLGLAADLKTTMTAKQTALVAADGAYEQARLDQRASLVALRKVIRTTRNHIRTVRELVRPDITPTYSQGWDAFGFVGNLRVPTKVEGLLLLLSKMGSHLAANPQLGEEEANLRATKIKAIESALLAANTALSKKKAGAQRALELRDEKAGDVRQALRELFSTLRFRLTPLDSRWMEFGFNKPGAKATPDVPTEVTAEVVGGNGVLMNWPPVARAQQYRPWKRVIGVDPEMVAIDATSDLNHLFERLPSGSEVEVALSALNSGGESTLSAIVVVRIG